MANPNHAKPNASRFSNKSDQKNTLPKPAMASATENAIKLFAPAAGRLNTETINTIEVTEATSTANMKIISIGQVPIPKMSIKEKH